MPQTSVVFVPFGSRGLHEARCHKRVRIHGSLPHNVVSFGVRSMKHQSSQEQDSKESCDSVANEKTLRELRSALPPPSTVGCGLVDHAPIRVSAAKLEADFEVAHGCDFDDSNNNNQTGRSAPTKVHSPPQFDVWLSERLKREQAFLEGFLMKRYTTLARDLESICSTPHESVASATDIPTSDASCSGSDVLHLPLQPIKEKHDILTMPLKQEAHNNTKDLIDPRKKAVIRAQSKQLVDDGSCDLTSVHIAPARVVPNHASIHDVQGRMLFVSQMSALVEERNKEATRANSGTQSLQFGLGARFEFIFGCLILLNTLVMILQRQYDSFDVGVELGIPSSRPSHETWPGAGTVFEFAEWIVGCCFVAELCARVGMLRLKSFFSVWIYFDTSVVVFWILGRMQGLGFNPTVARMVKLTRLCRLFRIVRFVNIFDPLHLLVKSVVSSVLILMWSLVLLVLLILVTAMMVSQSLENWLSNSSNSLDGRLAVYAQWGTMSRAIETVFEITLGNWGPPCRLLQNTVSEWWVVFFITYKCLVGFAVVQVITSVFIQQTFKTAARDEQVMINEKKSQGLAYLRSLENLFQVLDESGDGKITLAELEECTNDPTVKAWFAALEIDIHELSDLFDLLDANHDGCISRQEFIAGIKSLRGPARSVDVMCLRNATRRLEKLLLEPPHSG